METEKRWFVASVSSAAKDTQQQPSFRVIVFVFAFQSIFWTSAASRMSASLSGIVSEKMSQARMRRSRAYNYRRDGAPVEIYRLSLRAVGVTPKPQLRRHELNGTGAAARGSRPVHFDSVGGAVETPLFLRSELPAGASVEGPAIIDQLDSTTVVPPGWRADVDEWLNIRMRREAQS